MKICKKKTTSFGAYKHYSGHCHDNFYTKLHMNTVPSTNRANMILIAYLRLFQTEGAAFPGNQFIKQNKMRRIHVY